MVERWYKSEGEANEVETEGEAFGRGRAGRWWCASVRGVVMVVVWGENLDGSWVGAQKVTKVWRRRRLCVARGVGSLGGAVNDGRARLASLKPGCRAIGPWAWVEMPARQSGGVVGANDENQKKVGSPRSLTLCL